MCYPGPVVTVTCLGMAIKKLNYIFSLSRVLMQVAAKEGSDLTLVDGNFTSLDVSTLQEDLVQFFHCARSSFYAVTFQTAFLHH